MQKEKLTLNQAMFSVVLFNFGSSAVMGANTSVGQDGWITILVATIMAVPLFIMYSRMLQLFPEKNLFQIAELLFGTIGGKIISVLFVIYPIYLAALVLRNFSEFTQISIMAETPQLPITIIVALTAVYLAKSGMRTMGKWSIIMVGFVLSVLLFTIIASIKQIEVSNLLPVMSSPAKEVAKTSLQFFSFPYAETVLFLCLGDTLGREARSYKMFLWSLIAAAVLFLLVFFRNMTLLGQSLMSIILFPSYETARIIQVGGFIERIEGGISTNFLLAGILKVAVCLLAVNKGLVSIFRLKNNNALVLPAGLLAIALGTILYHNTMEMFAGVDYYFYYAIPFQVILPAIIWVAGELHVRKSRAVSDE